MRPASDREAPQWRSFTAWHELDQHDEAPDLTGRHVSICYDATGVEDAPVENQDGYHNANEGFREHSAG